MEAHGGRDGNEPTQSADERLDFIRDFILKAFRIKIEKWERMYISDEQRAFIHRFLDNGKPQVIQINGNIQNLRLGQGTRGKSLLESWATTFLPD